MAQESRVARCRGGVGGRLWILRKTESLGGKALLGLPKHLSGARRLLGRLTTFSLHGFISLRYCAFGRLGHRLLEGAKDQLRPVLTCGAGSEFGILLHVRSELQGQCDVVILHFATRERDAPTICPTLRMTGFVLCHLVRRQRRSARLRSCC